MFSSIFAKISNPVILAACIAAATSLMVSFFSQFFNFFSSSKLERLRSELLEEIEETRSQLSDFNASRSARRDYEYEARIRLYTQIEPLLFQLYEAAELSYYRVRSLARTSKNGNLSDDEKNWLQEGYYLYSTIYYMMLPSIVFRLIRARMTFVDLDLDERISTKYYLTKFYTIAWTDDFDLAAAGKTLNYDPNSPNRQSLVVLQPAVYSRQGLFVGDVESVLDQMLVKDGDITRAISYVEFEALWKVAPLSAAMARLKSLFFSFSPENKPVLARMLLVQACFSKLILEAFELDSAFELRGVAEAFIDSDEFTLAFAWRDSVGDDDAKIVLEYVTERLGSIPNKSGQSALD